ncbi:MAG: hypothetical protein JWN94_1977 [Betaproteobacteria bacterium]|nr:hypothetical protein [Betaproteobacteria bacterium]
MLVGLVVSTIVYFVASHYLKRYLDEMGAPKGFTRNALVFSAAVMISYGVAALIDWLAA